MVRFMGREIQYVKIPCYDNVYVYDNVYLHLLPIFTNQMLSYVTEHSTIYIHENISTYYIHLDIILVYSKR
jgi:hypothetical protein